MVEDYDILDGEPVTQKEVFFGALTMSQLIDVCENQGHFAVNKLLS